MELKDIVGGRLVSENVISTPNGSPCSDYKLMFMVPCARKNKVLMNQYITIESNSLNRCGFDTIKKVHLEIAGVIVETHSGRLLKDLARDAVIDKNRCRIPLQFFYCRGTPLILDALTSNEVQVGVELSTFDYKITTIELESTIVTAEKMRAPIWMPVKIINEDYVYNYESAIICQNKVYYISTIYFTYKGGCLWISKDR